MSLCGSEQARKLTGSYYTPIDVSRYFWNEFFRLRGIHEPVAALQFLKAHTFVEPSVGAGALFFSLLEKFLAVGVHPSELGAIHVDLIDLNAQALDFVKAQILVLEAAGDVSFEYTSYVHSDFLDCDYSRPSSPLMIFGNPPFVTNEKGISLWKNRFADFLDTALNDIGAMGSLHFIVPLSVAFSRDYSIMRASLIANERTIALSHFDNIPDTLFKSGKPKHENTNKANSQRCTIISSMPSPKTRVFSTKLNRWSKKNRGEFLATPAHYHNVTNYYFDDQIPRPQNENIFHYLQRSSKGRVTIEDYVSREGRYKLHVAGVARNYVGIRENAGSAVNTLCFSSKEDFLRILSIVTSDLFMDYWLTVGDGFHITRTNIIRFPIDDSLLTLVDAALPKAAQIWKTRKQYAKSKLNSGMTTKSYDFSDALDSLYHSELM